MGVNYDIHDFPTSQFGLKLGGFMLLEEEAAAQANASGSDDEEMKIPPKEVVRGRSGRRTWTTFSVGGPQR